VRSAEELARFITSPDSQVSPKAREHATGLILDSFAVMVLGSRQSSYQATAHALRRIGLLEPGAATVYSDRPFAASPFGAALLNATAMHLSEMGEGVSRAVVHASNAVVPAALAIAEGTEISGEHFVRSVALAMETTIRFGLMLNRPAHAATDRGDEALAYKAGWWTPSTLSGVGAATVTCLLRGLTAQQVVDAWGIALNSAPTTSVAFVLGGASGKGITMGMGCAGGLQAAELTAAGITGGTAIEKWSALLSSAPNPRRLSQDLGTVWELEFPLYKYFATVGPLHAAIEAALWLAQEHKPDPAEIEKIEVFGYTRTVQFLGEAFPHGEEAAKTSLRHVVAVALATGRADAFISDAFEPELRKDPMIGGLAAKVIGIVEPEYDAEYPMRSARSRLVLHLTGGRTLEHEIDRDRLPRYHSPSRADLNTKFAGIVVGGPDPDPAVQSVIDLVWQLPQTQKFQEVPMAVRAILEERDAI